MNNPDYGGIQWIQQHASAVVDSETDMLESSAADGEVTAAYLNGSATDEDLDHMAAENLIFMARDGHLSEIMSANEPVGGTVLITDAGVAYAESFDDDAQVVTEEIITDDWVQHQGAERVEIAAEQIAGNTNSLELLDMEQDEYTALRPYPCDFCSRRFRKKASLNNHMLAHQNDRPHLCKLCGARFSRRGELISHFHAHAEAQDAADAEAAAAAAAVAATVKFEPQQQQQQHHHQMHLQQQQPNGQIDDNFYEQEWPMYEEQDQEQENEQLHDQGQQQPHHQQQQQQMMVASSGAVQHATYPTVAGNMAAPTAARGRISRLKPKEESTQYIVIADKQTADAMDQYVDCEELQSTLVANAASSIATNSDNVPASNATRFPVLDESKPFVCQQCGLAFARQKALVSHMKNHRVDSPFECNQCQEMFWDNHSLQEHQKTHRFEESNSEYDPASAGEDSASESEQDPAYGDFYCNECGMSFHRQDLLRRHVKQNHKLAKLCPSSGAGNDADAAKDADAENTKDAPHSCHTCGKSFPSDVELLAHAEIHARFPPFKCVLCGISFYEEQAIKRHLHTRHPNELKQNSCVLCGKECRDRKALIKHAWDHSREKCHSCSKCGKNFHNKARLKRHMASHRDKSVVCEVCHEEFPDGRTLSNHRHSHSTTSPGKLFPCNECGKTFGSRSSQQIHVRIHTGERPYGCRYCWKAFADGGTLRKHERIHTGEKPYACSVCPRAFNQRVVLREHIRSHHSGLDTVRGTYHCTVCAADLSSSNDLIQHLIQHSDSNTAKQRQPITGPRKYKRRRKLQPHEIAHLRAENKDPDDYVSDIDLVDLDVENVDDYFEPSPPKKEKRKRNAASQAKVNSNGDTTTPATASASNNINNNNNNNIPDSPVKSTNADRIWEEKFLQANGNEDSFKTMFDSLVVVNDTTLHPVDGITTASPPKTRRSAKLQQAQAQSSNSHKSIPTAAVEEATKPTASLTTSSRSRKRTTKSSKSATAAGAATGGTAATTSRPRMIHTEKSRVPPENASKRNRGRSYVTRTCTSESSSSQLDLVKSSSVASSHIVDDYEIISPATQPPNQISSSPLHIKQEQELHQQQQQRVPLMYDDTHLLIAAALREKTYEKFNPSIVNDLEEILRSPLKHDRNARLRFTSESSTTPQFLPEEEQNLIKIEPTSPDLREMVESQQRVSSTGHGTTPTSSSSSSAARTSRHLRQITANSSSRQTTSSTTKRNSSGKNVSTSAGSKKSASSTSSSSVAGSKSNSYLSYGVDSYNVNVVSANANSSDVSSGFFSISEVVSAADAADAAAKAAAAHKTERRVRCYECEMCSANFPDRAQLLEHMHIHI